MNFPRRVAFVVISGLSLLEFFIVSNGAEHEAVAGRRIEHRDAANLAQRGGNLGPTIQLRNVSPSIPAAFQRGTHSVHAPP
jgi:hypothetical protein